MEILWKSIVFAYFWAIHPKPYGNFVFPQNFHTRKLFEITVIFAVGSLNSKLYQSILRSFLSNKKSICSFFFSKWKTHRWNESKTQLFHYFFFVNLCSMISNSSYLPKDISKITSETLQYIIRNENDITKMWYALDAHGQTACCSWNGFCLMLKY